MAAHPVRCARDSQIIKRGVLSHVPRLVARAESVALLLPAQHSLAHDFLQLWYRLEHVHAQLNVNADKQQERDSGW